MDSQERELPGWCEEGNRRGQEVVVEEGVEHVTRNVIPETRRNVISCNDNFPAFLRSIVQYREIKHDCG